MLDAIATILALIGVSVAVAFVAARFPQRERGWVWLAYAEHLLSGAGQYAYSLVETSDQNGYRYGGAALEKLLEVNFRWASGELFNLLIQQPSSLNTFVLGPGSNTGSMFAASAWLQFFTRGSTYAVQVILVGMGTFAGLAFYATFRDALPRAKPLRIFFATALFPSVAFWTCGLLKETFCVFGMGLILLAWRALYRRNFIRALLCAPAGVVFCVLFRAPCLPPLLFGFVAYFLLDRQKRAVSKAATPIYIGMAVAAVVFGLIGVARISPDLSIDRINDTVAVHQRAWSINASTGGGSGFDLDEDIAVTPAQQAARAPIALLNALLRPQLFDVRNGLMLISALEMTVITVLLLTAFKRLGLRGTVAAIFDSPFLLMCALVTVVGCTFVGLTTLNFGSLSRYRAPFLPFYGTLLAVLSEVPAPIRAAVTRTEPLKRLLPRRRRQPPLPAPQR